jgi:hypothetical protein
MHRAFVTAFVLLAAACGLDVKGAAPGATTSTNPTDPVGGGSGSGSKSDAGTGDDDATVGACSDSVLAFDGVDDFVTIAKDDALELRNDFTVEAWVKPGARTSEMEIVSHHDDSGTAGWALRIVNARAEIVVWGNDTFQGDMGYAAGNSGPTYVVPGKWAHVAGTLSGGTLRIYWDGALRDTQDLATFFGRYDFGGPIVIGRSATGDPFAFEGEIDDVRLSKDAKYTGNTASKPAAPFASDAATVALWSFDEIATQSAIDVSMHGHDGMLGSNPSTPTRIAAPCVTAR